MYKAFIEPDLQTAHIKITNKFNPFTGFQTPTYILKVTLYVMIFYFLSLCVYLLLFLPKVPKLLSIPYCLSTLENLVF